MREGRVDFSFIGALPPGVIISGVLGISAPVPLSSPKPQSSRETMASLCKIQPSLHLSLHRPCCPKPPFSSRLFPKSPSSKTLFRKTPSKTLKPFSLKASPSSNHHIPTSSSSSSSPPSPPLPSMKSPLPTFAKTISISLVTAAALLLARFHRNPAIAAAPTASPPPTVGSRSSDAAAGETVQSREQEEGEQRERSLEQQLDGEPDDVSSLRELMETKIKLQKIPEAIDILDRLIALQPNVADWPLLRAHLHLYGGDINVARSSFEEIITADPFRVEGYHGLAMVALQTDAEDIEELMKRIEGVMQRCRKENKKALREFKFLEAQVRVIEEKYEEALKIYQGLVKDDPTDFRPYLCQGIIYTLLNKMDEAEKQFEKYRRLVPKGHPYAEYFNENVLATKVFAEMTGKDKADSTKVFAEMTGKDKADSKRCSEI